MDTLDQLTKEMSVPPYEQHQFGLHFQAYLTSLQIPDIILPKTANPSEPTKIRAQQLGLISYEIFKAAYVLTENGAAFLDDLNKTLGPVLISGNDVFRAVPKPPASFQTRGELPECKVG